MSEYDAAAVQPNAQSHSTHEPYQMIYVVQDFNDLWAMKGPYQICKGFAARGWQTKIVTNQSAANKHIDMAWGTVPVQKTHGASRRARILRIALLLLPTRRRTMVLAQVWDWPCFALLLSRLLFGSPYAIRLDSYLHRAPFHGTDFWTQLHLELRYGLVLRNANVIIAESPEARHYIEIAMRRPQVLEIPSCLWRRDLEAIEHQWLSEGFAPDRRPTILFTGRVVRTKRIHDLIEAFSALSEQYPAWSVEIRGPIVDPDYFASLKELVSERKLEQRIEFAPTIIGSELFRRYRLASIYCLPSAFEGMSTALSEAMYFCGPVIATLTGSTAYQLNEGRAGLLLAPGDVPQLIHHLDALMGDPQLRADFGVRARQRVLDCYTWEKHFDQIEEVFLRQIGIS